jgi:hypothetical protein
MPRKRTQAKRRVGYKSPHVTQLECGTDYFRDAFGTDREALRQGWVDLGPEVLRRWIFERPGTRPWAWWEFDSPNRSGRPEEMDRITVHDRIVHSGKDTATFGLRRHPESTHDDPPYVIPLEKWKRLFRIEIEHLHGIDELTGNERKILALKRLPADAVSAD